MTINQLTPEDRVRIDLAPIYSTHADLRLFVRPGDEVICKGEWAVVLDVYVSRAGRHPNSAARNDWDAVMIKTSRGMRSFGYPPNTLPRNPVSRKRPLF